MDLYAGTSGYSYKEWKGGFYPEDATPEAMLGLYSAKLPAVEINNTFYRMPKRTVLESWCDQVPEAFRFSIKASRRITHMRRLTGVEGDMEFLVRNLATMGQRLGAVLFQLPPNMKADPPRLEAFQALLPPAARAAFEFRHASWFTDEVFERLRARNHALVHVDGHDHDDERSPGDIVPTADWGYLRLRREDYSGEAIQDWRERIESLAWREAFVFFKHETLGPHFAGALLGRADAAGALANRPASAAKVEVRKKPWRSGKTAEKDSPRPHAKVKRPAARKKAGTKKRAAKVKTPKRKPSG